MKKLMLVDETAYNRYVCPTCGATIFTQDKTNNYNPFEIDADVYCKHCGEKLYFKEDK